MKPISPAEMTIVTDPAAARYQDERVAHWDALARLRDHWKGLGGLYHQRLTEIYQFLVPARQRVLEIGCGEGSLLAALQPAEGVGIDFSPEMIARARRKYPQLQFVLADAHALSAVQGTFDVIILSNLVNDLWDVQAVLEQVAQHCTERTRVIVDYYSHLWNPPLSMAQNLKLAAPNLQQNWLAHDDIRNLFHLTGFDIVRAWQEILWPVRFPVLDTFFNRYLVRLPFFRDFALVNFMIARLQQIKLMEQQPSVTVVVPARNEAGNVPAIIARVPHMGSTTELVFVEGHSRDDTYAAIEREIAEHPEISAKLLCQSGVGKADAVRAGFAAATGDILMILDADLTVPPEDLPRFYQALVSNRGEFINGVRLVYPMEQDAMRGLNFLGNKFFSLAFSWLLGQPIKDTLCGTKVLWKADYEKLVANRAYFGDFDPFGDFDLIFGAAKLNLKIVDLPIRYRERVYGSTNIDRWRHGWLLLKMVWFAAARLKFI